ncbi:hypothetical protein K431DRAFT_289196 [Polychaeton citri CBS 116435]|uniref:Uncharacterized protein n=1 Tax=Polychaeton citri CBS 116435 TaxID=1314669 RepID=A0A9P4UIB3_9PEZI|nr:hypothetical protein K431DRAFT_289196 [Polychaeton citri CBS 116435]
MSPSEWRATVGIWWVLHTCSRTAVISTLPPLSPERSGVLHALQETFPTQCPKDYDGTG